MSEFENVKKWLEETKDKPIEEMGSFFCARVEEYEQHMTPWREYYKWLAELIPFGAETLLDIGCGTGLELDEILRKYPQLQVTGIDLSTEMLKKLKQKHLNKNLTLICADYFKEPFGIEKFDVAVSFETLHHFKGEKKVQIFQKIYESLKKGGCYLEGDYIAESEKMEQYLFEECERRSNTPIIRAIK